MSPFKASGCAGQQHDTMGRPQLLCMEFRVSLCSPACCVTTWNNLNLSELHCHLLENGALFYRIKVYKVFSKELAYRKQLVDVTCLMMVRQGGEKLVMKRVCKAKIRGALEKL